MIKPSSYWALHKSADAYTLGRVGATLGGQTVEPPLNLAERALVNLVKQDSEWMDERIDAKRKRWADAKTERRAANGAETSAEKRGQVETSADKRGQVETSADKRGQVETSADKRGQVETSADTTDVSPCPPMSDTIHPSIHPSVHPSVKLKTNINRSVPVNAREGNGNGNGTADKDRFLTAPQRAVEEFKAAFHKDKGAFFDPQHPAAVICLALTKDWKSAARWNQLVRRKGDAKVREEAYAFYCEVLAGEAVDNPAAVLNKRLGDLPDLDANGREVA